MDVSLVLEDFFVRVRISPVIKDLQKVKREVSYFPYVVRKKKKSRHELSKNRSMRVKIVKYLVRIIFIPLDAFIICKMNEKPGKMYQKCLITYSVAVFCGSFRISPIL